MKGVFVDCCVNQVFFPFVMLVIVNAYYAVVNNIVLFNFHAKILHHSALPHIFLCSSEEFK